MINDLLDLVREMGAWALEGRKSALETQYKSDDSPVTKVDLRIDRHLNEALRKIKPIPCISEESPLIELASNAEHWLVDPIDGTKEFIRGGNDFTVNVALIANGQVRLGVVFAPALNELFWAEQGKGAFKNGSKLPQAQGPAKSTAVISRSHLDPSTDQLLRELKVEVRHPLGSSLKICRVADGTADFYPRLGPTMEWDIAAAHIVADESGCHLKTWPALAEFTYGKTDKRNPHFVVANAKWLDILHHKKF